MSRDLDLTLALRRGRDAVEAYRLLAQDLGDEWTEEHATIDLLYACRPVVRFANFNRQQEHRVGADWLWWWQDSAGECFGALVQAKRIKPHKDGWFFDFRYPRNSDRQRMQLMETAHVLRVAPLFALYCGAGDLRRGFGCTSGHSGPDCEACAAMAVAIVTGIQVHHAVLLSQLRYPGHSAEDALRFAVPLESLADSRREQRLHPPIPDLPDDMYDLLQERQVGARHIAKAILAMVLRERGLQHGRQVAGTLAERSRADEVFARYPTDPGSHGFTGYFEMILSGLRTQLPEYVEHALETSTRPAEVPSHIAGVAVLGS